MHFRGVQGIVAAALLCLAAPAAATTIEVETDGDEFGGGPGGCALREAVEAARTNKAFGGCPKGGKNDVIQLIGDAVLTIDGDTATNADGDLDYNKGGRLTIRGEDGPAIDPPEIHQDFSDRILEITKQKGVVIEGVSMEGGGDVEAGGAVRVAEGGSATLAHVHLHDNIAEARGGAIACEGCASLRLTGAFQIEDNLVLGSAGTEGGAIWSDRPTTLKGTAGGPLFFTNSRIVDNTADPTGTNSIGGAIYAGHNLRISDTYFLDNQAAENGLGGAIALSAQGKERRLTLVRSTLEQNEARTGGGIYARADGRVLDLRRSAITDNSTIGAGGGSGGAFGGGIYFFDGGGRIADSVISGNTATASASGDTAAGGGIMMRDDASPAATLKLIRSGVTGNSVAVGASSQRGGGLVIQGRLVTVNATIADNDAPAAGADGGGVRIETSGLGSPSARFDFTTFAQNSADNGASIATEAPVEIRASILDDGTDGCVTGSPGQVTSEGFNVEDNIDADCEIDAATDVHTADFLNALQDNGSFPAGAAGNEIEPLTSAFTNDTSAALDIVPPQNCKVNAKELRTDARGLPRPEDEGCDAGATERSRCGSLFVVGTDAHVGTKADDFLQGSGTDIFMGLAGDDNLALGPGNDIACAGSGDDVIRPSNGNDSVKAGSGRDVLNYNDIAGVMGLDIDLAAGESVDSNGDQDSFTGIEDVQASEGGDELSGDNKANLLIGGGDPDEIRGRGGIDVIDAKDGEVDPVINCGPGDNSKEKAKVDPIDPAPVSC